MSDLIHTIKLKYDVEYKVIIKIDDLDRLPLPKVCVTARKKTKNKD